MIVKLLLKGMVIGVANIIPGVSGGTMALVLGIYDRLIAAIGHFRARSFMELRDALKVSERTAALRRFAEQHDLLFLLLLALGALVGIFGFSHLLEYLLDIHPGPTFGFFFGLVGTSVIVPYSLLRRKSWRELVAALIAVLVTVGLSQLKTSRDPVEARAQEPSREIPARFPAISSPASFEEAAGPSPAPATESPGPSYAFFFLAGAVAAAAMILPGVSGSFILLLFGVYFDVLRALTNLDAAVLAVFGLGCVVGLVVFVKFLNFLLARYYSPTMAFLAGLMVGSLWSLWPCKDVARLGDESLYRNVWPRTIGPTEWLTIVAAGLGVAVVLAFFIYERKSAAAAQSSPAPGSSPTGK